MFLALLLILALVSCAPLEKGLGFFNKEEMSASTIAAGLREALEQGTGNAVARLGRKGGYGNSRSFYIPAPPELEKVTRTLRKIGLGSLVSNFEARMNRGAELAAAKAKPVFWKAIRQMSFRDAKGILTGPDTAATDYFEKTIGSELKALYRPVVARELNNVGALRAYSEIVKQYNALPMTQKPALDLESYATDKALAGLFALVAQEEKKIRHDPAARTTELLRQVFGETP